MFHGVIQKITLAQFFWDMVYDEFLDVYFAASDVINDDDDDGDDDDDDDDDVFHSVPAQ